MTAHLQLWGQQPSPKHLQDKGADYSLQDNNKKKKKKREHLPLHIHGNEVVTKLQKWLLDFLDIAGMEHWAAKIHLAK